MKLLKHARGLRGTIFDPFGRTAERAAAKIYRSRVLAAEAAYFTSP
jgi:hypothetical protein